MDEGIYFNRAEKEHSPRSVIVPERRARRRSWVSVVGGQSDTHFSCLTYQLPISSSITRTIHRFFDKNKSIQGQGVEGDTSCFLAPGCMNLIFAEGDLGSAEVKSVVSGAKNVKQGRGF